MLFSQLYGIELDRELGSTDRTLFTVERRQAAINAGQTEWIKRTECLIRRATLALVTLTQEYDMESSIADFGWLSKQGPSIKIVSGSSTRYVEGDDLLVTTIEELNADEPGWRTAPASTPTRYYLVRDGGTSNIGFHPAPKITGSDVWTVILPYVVVPTDMSADSDEPFAVSGNPLRSLRVFHRALAHYGAYDLEKFRKDDARASAQLQLFELEVAKFVGVEKPKQGRLVRFVKDYRLRTHRSSTMFDPRTT